MKAKILKSISFILIFIILLMITSYIVMPKRNTEEAGMHDYEANGILAEKANTIDVLILGDSEAFTSIIPMQLWNDYGYTSYVCCSTEQTVPESASFLMKALKKQKPKMVIVEASNICRSTKREEHLEQLLNYSVPAYEYHNRWKSLQKDDWFGKIDYSVVNHLKGYHFTKEVKEAEENDKMKPTDEEIPIPRSNKLYFKLLNKYCRLNNIKLCLIRTPTTYSWDYRSHNAMIKLSNEENVEFTDYNVLNDEIKIDWKHDSKDGGDHLNYYGAQKCTEFLGKYLNQQGFLEDHRNNESYQEWNNSYKIYEDIVQNNL